MVSEESISIEQGVDQWNIMSPFQSGHSGSKQLVLNKQKNEEICDACARPISIPFYNCHLCNFFLHQSCAELPNELQHPCHPHPLHLCGTCNFSLHDKCALLPRSLRHKYDKHHFITLNYVPIEDGPNECICKFCEYEINPECCFYHCIDCD
ncbi:protein VACUOLELESS GAMETOPHYTES-like [Actinidia eriantha]|uniref:protein VACUOLELESS GAMETOPHYTES-like n=1 Tax=Actinidia eriantha TaxID=165200 RepID=UPI0025832BAC|nr:protein VACUOLELESS GAMETOPHYTES-like [Actinidia eriantha]